MGSETRAHAVRIASNFFRLGTSFGLGLVLVPLLLAFGEEAYGLITLLTTTVGLGMSAQGVIRKTMIHETGSVLHAGDMEAYREVLSTALVVSWSLASALCAALLGLAVVLPDVFNMPAELEAAGRWFVGAAAIHLLVTVGTAPVFNLLIVVERMPAFNLWLTVLRATLTASAAVVVVLGMTGAEAVITYGVLTSALGAGVMIVASTWLLWTEPQLRPVPFQPSRAAVRSLVSSGGWNAAAGLAVTTHFVIGAVLMNAVFGVLGNAVFGIASQLSGYVRMVASGLTSGLEAVAARLSVDGGGAEKLIGGTTALSAWVIFPTALILIVWAEPIVTVWLGPRMENPQVLIPRTVALVRLMGIGVGALSLAEGWTSLLYGTGHARRYAPLYLGVAVAFPTLALVGLAILPDEAGFLSVGWSYAVANGTALLGALPFIVAKWAGVSWATIVRPVLRPALTTALTAPLLIGMSASVGDGWTVALLAGGLAAAGLWYAVLSVALMLGPTERKRWATKIGHALGART